MCASCSGRHGGEPAMNQDNAKAATTVPTEGQSGGAGEVPGGHVQVMTDEQVEVLRKQISIYATICDQLLEMHNAQDAARQGSSIVTGRRFGPGSLYGDPPMVHGGNGKKITGLGRRRWAPTQMQLQILETIFGQGHAGALPRKQEITDITAELSQHGQVAEANVYNWFQNRRARAKRRRGALLPNEAESETQRWAPTQMQLQILKTVFVEGNGALPRKQEITDITTELSRHGQVAESNVYIWFQNHRARAKRDLKRRRGELL